MKVDHYIHDVSTLDSEESSMLFNWHAFHANEAPDDYKDLAKDVVGACGGLPLALKVIGSSLFDKRLDEDRETIWPEAVRALRQSTDVMGVLRWSYDSFSEEEKRMFIDITCLFYGQSVDEALAYWRSCENCTSCGGVLTPQISLRMRAKSHIVNEKIAEATIVKKQVSYCLIDLIKLFCCMKTNVSKSNHLGYINEKLLFLGINYSRLISK
jgi:hypothetical protein